MPLRTGSIAEGAGGVTKGGLSTAIGGTGFPPGGGALRFSGLATPSVLANSTTETLFTGYTIPVNTITAVGTLIRMRAGFKYSTTGTPALNIRAYIGGLLGLRILNVMIAATTSGAANNAIVAEVDAMIDAGPLSAATLRYGLGQVAVANAGAGTQDGVVYPSPTVAGGPTGTIDFTAAQTIGFAAQWGTASASNTITQYSNTVEIMIPVTAG